MTGFFSASEMVCFKEFTDKTESENTKDETAVSPRGSRAFKHGHRLMARAKLKKLYLVKLSKVVFLCARP